VDAADIDRLRALGITHVLNVAIDLDMSVPAAAGLVCKHLPLADTETEDIYAHFPAACDWLHAAHAAGGRVLVHCLYGLSRAPTIAIAYLLHRELAAPRGPMDARSMSGPRSPHHLASDTPQPAAAAKFAPAFSPGGMLAPAPAVAPSPIALTQAEAAFRKAFDSVRAVRPDVQPNSSFEEALRRWAAHLVDAATAGYTPATSDVLSSPMGTFSLT
jgi:predicted protein tyrosine phosphatase